MTAFKIPALRKNLSIIAIDAAKGVGNGRTLPAGPLREPLPAQIRRADALVIIGRGDAASDVAAAFEAKASPVLRAHFAPSGDVGWLTAAPIIAFAGIGRPKKFFDTLTDLGAELRHCLPYPDHHPYSETDARGLLDLAKRNSAQLVTTEKDWIRMARSDAAMAALRKAARPLAIRLEWENARQLDALLQPVLAERS